MRVDLNVGHVAAGILGAVVAWAVLQPSLRRWDLKDLWPQLAAAGLAIAVAAPVMVVLVAHTKFFVDRGMAEVGSPAFQEPPLSEEAAERTRDAFRPGDTWAYTTDGGRCSELLGYYWLAFRFVPHVPDCDDPDVELFWQHPPPAEAPVLQSGDDYAVVHW